MGIDKGRTIIRKDEHGDFEPAKTVVSDEVGYDWPDSSHEGN